MALLWPAAATAQPPLTIEQAVQAAVAHNASLRVARAGVDEATARASEARSGFYPRVSVTESWQRGDQPVFVFSSLLSARHFAASNFAIESLNHPDPIGFFQTSVGLEQTIFDGGRQRAAANSASLEQAIASASADEATARIAVTAAQTFGRIVLADAGSRALDAGLAAAREDLARAERRRDAGMATDADVLSLVVHVADLEQRAIESRSARETACAELNRLMGAPIDADVLIAAPQTAPDGSQAGGTLRALIEEAERNRPELKRAAAAHQLALDARTEARSALIPQISGQAAFDVSGTQFTDRASAWIVGAQFRWTFSTGGGELAAVKAAAAADARSRAEIDDVRAAVDVDVVTAAGRARAARAREAVARAAIDQARESQRIIRDRFEQGLAPINDVLRASNALLDADANHAAAIVDALVAEAALRRAIGRTP